MGPAPSAQERVIRVVWRSDSRAVSESDLRGAIERELHVKTVGENDPADATLTVTYRASNGELAVAYFQPSKGTITRVIPAPEQSSDVPSTAALLAGNLARNEADEFLQPKDIAPPASPPTSTPTPTPTPATEPVAPPYRAATASLFYPLATHGSEPDARTHLDLNLLYGSVGELDGVGLGTVNRVKNDARGLQLALASNFVEGKMHGVQISIASNHARRELEGVQLAGVGTNFVRGPVQGIQAAVLGGNVAEGALTGAQASLGLNFVGSDVDGLQAAPVLNYAGGRVRGAQLALGFNYAGDAVAGPQAALGLNVAGDVSGGQLGLINIAKNVRGVQFGLINIADDVDGVPLGLVSVSKSGGVHAVAWASNTSFANAGLKFATRHTYTMFSGSAHQENGVDLFGPGFTVGGRFPISRFFLETDIGATHLFGNRLTQRQDERMAELRSRDVTLLKLRVAGGYEFAKHFSVFAGVGATAKVRYAGVPAGGPPLGTNEELDGRSRLQ